MLNSDFREIAHHGAPDKAERLFRASISAYCSLSHPTRAETSQLEDLTLPLYSSVSEDGLRFVAAALSECAAPPVELVRRLATEGVEISAPLIVRTPVLSDADLISLIAQNGVAHARVIARRKDLNPAIAALIGQIEMNQTKPAYVPPIPAAPASQSQESQDMNAEDARHKLRGMMVPSRVTKTGIVPANSYLRLRAAALSGDRNQVIATLSQSLDIDLETAAGMLRPDYVPVLISALRALALTGEQALLIVACSVPDYMAQPGAARELIMAFASESMTTARKRVVEYGANDSSEAYARELSRAALARSA